MEKFSLFKHIWETEPVGEIGIEEMCQIIRNDALKPYTESVRNAKNKTEKNYAKKILLNVTVNGTFCKRGNENLMSYSGLTCLDFDHIPKEEWDYWRDGMLRWEYTHALFTSPSGEGLKLIMRHDLQDPDLHWNLYGQLVGLFKDTYGCPYIDTGVKDVSRATYLPYDPECFVNMNSLVWHFEFDPAISKITKSVCDSTDAVDGSGEAPISTQEMMDRNAAYQTEWSDKALINYIDKHQWSYFPEDYEEGHRNNSILRKAGQLYRCGVSYEAAVDKLVHLYSHTFADVPENDVITRVKYIYYLHKDDFGKERETWLYIRNEGLKKYGSKGYKIL